MPVRLTRHTVYILQAERRFIMFDKLEALETRYEEVNIRLSEPDIINDQESFKKLCKESSELAEIVEKYREYKHAKDTVAECKEILQGGDKELAELAKLELSSAEDSIEAISEALKILLLSKNTFPARAASTSIFTPSANAEPTNARKRVATNLSTNFTVQLYQKNETTSLRLPPQARSLIAVKALACFSK